MKLRALYLIFAASLLLLMTCADPIDMSLIQVAEDEFPPEVLEINATSGDYYYSQVTIEGYVQDSSLEIGDSVGLLYSLSYSVSPYSSIRGKITIDPDGNHTIDTTGEEDIFFDIDTGFFRFSFDSENLDAELTITVFIEDANGNITETDFKLSKSPGPYFSTRLYEIDANGVEEDISGFKAFQTIYMDGTISDSVHQQGSTSEIQSVKWIIVNKGKSLTLDLITDADGDDEPDSYNGTFYNVILDDSDLNDPELSFYPDTGYFESSFFVPFDWDYTGSFLQIAVEVADKNGNVTEDILPSIFLKSENPIISKTGLNDRGFSSSSNMYTDTVTERNYYSPRVVGNINLLLEGTVDENGPVVSFNYNITAFGLSPSATDVLFNQINPLIIDAAEITDTGEFQIPLDPGLLDSLSSDTVEIRLYASTGLIQGQKYYEIYADADLPQPFNKSISIVSPATVGYAAEGDTLLLNFNIWDKDYLVEPTASGLNLSTMVVKLGNTVLFDYSVDTSGLTDNLDGTYSVSLSRILDPVDAGTSPPVLDYSIYVEDYVGNIYDVTTGSGINFYYGDPGVSNVQFLKNGSLVSSSDWVKHADDVTIRFTVDRDMMVIPYDPKVTIAGHEISASNGGSGNIWTASYTMSESSDGDGVVTYFIDITDKAGNQRYYPNAGATPGDTPLEFDATAPSEPPTPDLITDSGVAGDNITNDTTPTFTGTAEASSTVMLYRSGSTDPIGNTTSDNLGDWTITVGSALAQGTYDITAEATDAAGNTSDPSITPLSITIDTSVSAPSTPDMTALSDGGISDTDNITADTTPTYEGTAEDGALVTLYHSDTVAIGSATASGGNWSITADPLTSGDYTIKASAVDIAGNTSALSGGLNVSIDQTKPSVNSVSPIDGTINLLGDTNIIISFDDDLGTALGTVTLNGTTYTDGSNCTISISGDQVTLNPSGNLSTGTYTGISVTGFEDRAGNSMNVYTDGAYDITIDATAPTVSSVTPADGTGDLPGDTNIIIDFSENLGSTLGTVTLNSTTFTNGVNSVISILNDIVTVNPNSDFGTATYTDITIEGFEDVAGNIMTSYNDSDYDITIDATDPVAPSTPDMTAATDSGIDDDNETNDTTPDFTGTAEDGSTVTLYRSGSIAIGTDTASGGTWTITSSALGNGAHSITAVAVDAAGNSSPPSGALSITIDTSVSAPSQPDMDTASDSGTYNSDNITTETAPVFSGTAEQGALVTLYYGGTNSIGTDTADSSGDWSITATPALSPGDYTITAKAVDIAGNISVASSGLLITIDSTGPSVSTISPTDNSTDILGNANIIITFDEDLGTTKGTITFDGETYSSSEITISGDQVTINPDTDFTTGNYSDISIDGFFDLAGNAMSAAYSDANYDFTVDADAPSIVTDGISPADNATGIASTTNIVITFDEPLSSTKGTIVFAGITYIDATNCTITISGSQVTLDPIANFTLAKHSNMQISGFQDVAGNTMSPDDRSNYDFTVDH